MWLMLLAMVAVVMVKLILLCLCPCLSSGAGAGPYLEIRVENDPKYVPQCPSWRYLHKIKRKIKMKMKIHLVTKQGHGASGTKDREQRIIIIISE